MRLHGLSHSTVLHARAPVPSQTSVSFSIRPKLSWQAIERIYSEHESLEMPLCVQRSEIGDRSEPHGSFHTAFCSVRFDHCRKKNSHGD